GAELEDATRHLARHVGRLLARGRGPPSARAPDEESHAELALEARDATRDRGLVDYESARRRARRAVLAHGEKKAEVVPIDHPVNYRTGGWRIHAFTGSLSQA